MNTSNEILLKKIKCNELATSIKTFFNLKETLYINYSKIKLFNNFENNSDLELKYIGNKKNIDGVMCGDPYILLDKIKDRFDFIVGDLSLGLNRVEWKDEGRNIYIKERKNLLIILKSLFILNKKGYGLFVVEPAIFSNKKFIEELNRNGFYVNAAFNCPDKVFYPETAVRPLIVLLSRNESNSLFTVELDVNSIIEDLLISYKKRSAGSDFATGLWFMFDKFRGFKQIKVFEKVTKLLEQYKTFKVYPVSQISKSINLGDKIKRLDNSIYIPRAGKIVQFEYEKVKSKNYYQVVLNPKFAIAEYLALFLNTDVGRSLIELIETGDCIPNKTRENIEQLQIPLPELDIQKEIVELSHKFIDITSKISEFEKEIALNPLSCQKIKTEVDRLLDSLNILNESDKILALIREGESKTIEFKSTLSKNIRTNQKDKEIEKACLKTLVAFMNTDGGKLLIGVADKGNVSGIEEDFFNSNDDYLKHIHNLIRDNIGEQFYPLIDYKIVDVLEKKVLFVSCKKSNSPVYLGRDEEFYVRTNPATDKLTGKKLVEYIRNHFTGSNI
jgi:hypothetical protein